MSTDADPGLYGPDSVTWRVHGDPIMALAGIRALLLQALHPLAMAGVAQHSDFREDPWGRLFRTASYVGATTYGTTTEATRAGARVRGIHKKLSATFEGETFRIDDPHLLLWVHCSEAESFLTTVTRCGLRLSSSEKDRYYAEQVANARLVGLSSAPASVSEMADYFASMRPELRLTPDATAAAKFVLNPPMPRRFAAARPAWLGVTSVGFGMLPRWARRLYRLPGLPTTDVGATAAGLALRTSLMALPADRRRGPAYTAALARVAG